MRIDIFDTQGGIFDPGLGMPGEDFCTDEVGAIIRQEGNSRDIYQSIQPSSCTFRMLVENEAHRSFLNDLALAEENRFYIHVVKGSSFKVFIGSIIIDEIQIEDTYQSKYFLTINATDGFADLQNIEYSDDGMPYTGRVPVTEHLENVFAKLPTFEILQNSSVYTFTSLFAAEMSGTGVSALEQAYVDHAVFQKHSEDKVIPFNCYDVLRHILEAFDMRLFTNGQHVYIASWNFYGNPTKDIHTYIYQVGDMTAGSPGEIAIQPIPVCDSEVKAVLGGIKVLQAPARSVSVTYQHGSGKNWLFGQRFIEIGYTDQCYIAGIIPTLEPDTRFHFTGNIRFFLSKERELISNGARFVILVKIKLGENYFMRAYGVIAGSVIQLAPTWTTDDEYYVIPSVGWVEKYDESTTFDYTDSENFEILSDVIPESAYGENLEICFTYKLIDRDNNLLPQSDYPSSVNIENPVFNFVLKDNVLVENTANVITVLNSVNNSRHFERTLLIGDGPNPEANSRITVMQGGEHVDTTEWTDSHIGLGPYTHTEMIARLMIARRVTALQFKEGDFINYDHALEPILYDNLIYIPLLTDYMTALSRTGGEWVSISLGEVAALDHITQEIDDAKLAPGTPSRPNSGDVVTRPVRKTYVGPLTEVTPHVNIDFVLSLPVDEQAAIVHMYKNGVKMNLKTTPTGINDYQIVDNGGAKLKPAIGFTSMDQIETNYFL